jgi:hypothetical protein
VGVRALPRTSKLELGPEDFMIPERSVTFNRETRAATIDEMRPLFTKHWEEIALNRQKIKLDPNDRLYEQAEAQGVLRVYTVRDLGALVGYAVFFVKFHPHYRGVLWASSDIFWVERRLRTNRGIFDRMWRKMRYFFKPQLIRATVGARFFDFIESQMRQEGVAVIHYTTKSDHPAAGRVLRYLGYAHIENGYSKFIGA